MFGDIEEYIDTEAEYIFTPEIALEGNQLIGCEMSDTTVECTSRFLFSVPIEWTGMPAGTVATFFRKFVEKLWEKNLGDLFLSVSIIYFEDFGDSISAEIRFKPFGTLPAPILQEILEIREELQNTGLWISASPHVTLHLHHTKK